jgi:predicted GIY-YIG superfamily endonuclease
MIASTSIFVVQLEHDKFYVGESKDPVKRLEELREGLGPQWTHLHKPLYLTEVHQFKDTSKLDTYVKMFMRRHSIDRVRGGSFEAAVLPPAVQSALDEELHGESSGCIVA